MVATSVSRNASAAPRNNPRDPSRVVFQRRDPALEARYKQLHAQIIAGKTARSGRAGRYVYYWAYGRLCWRVYVVPKDPRTAPQQRSRAAFAAASTAWSQSQPLTEEQRYAWYAAAAEIKSTPRLGQSGPLTAQQHFVGRNSRKERWGLSLLLQPSERESQQTECRRQDPISGTQALERQRVAQSSSSTHQACAELPPAPRPVAGTHAWKALGGCAPLQVLLLQRLTRPSSDRHRSTSRPPPEQCRCRACFPDRLGNINLPRWSFSLPKTRRSSRSRELWRGG